MAVSAPEDRDKDRGKAREHEGQGRALHLTRRSFLGGACAAAAGLGLYAGEGERHWITVERVPITIEHLPEAFEGMRIAQVSDIHFAEYTEPGYLRRVVEHVNALRPEMVLLTGDFVSMSPMTPEAARGYVPLCGEILAGLVCRERYGVIGNHDWTVGEEAVAEGLRASGVHMLINQYLPLERGADRIWVAGTGSALGTNLDIPATVPPHALASKEPVIMMAHEPDVWDALAPYGVDLVLSGHTHGGQVRVPFLPPVFLPPLGERYVEGHFKRGRTQLYVNRGVGAVGLPFRFRCPPEITLLTLQRG